MAERHPELTHLKVVTGNPGKRNDKEPTPAREMPSPPALYARCSIWREHYQRGYLKVLTGATGWL